jgi:putative ABC transport system permease protein
MLEALLLDLRYSLRRIKLSPLFTVIAALSLAIGIGANTAIFSLGNALLLRPIAGVQEQKRLVDVGRTQSGQGFDTVSYPNYVDLRDRTKTMEGIYAYDLEAAPMSLGTAADAERVYGTVVSGNYFEMLGVRARTGRLLQDADDRTGSPAVAVISESLWQRRFGGDAGLPGRTITLNGQPVTVLGVVAEGFSGTTIIKHEVWMPISAAGIAMPRLGAAATKERAGAWLMMGARLRPGVSIKQADAELGAMGAVLEQEYPKENSGRGYRAVALSQFPGRASMVGGFIALLMTIVSLVLLIACVNLVGMLLARSAEREREIAVRLAIGASRGRLIRQLLTETLALFVVGGAAGLVLSQWIVGALLTVVPQLPVPIALRPTTDWRVVIFAALVTIFAGIMSGLAPALQASSRALVTALKNSGGDAGPGKMRLRDAFVVSQVMMSLVLVIIGGLFIRAVSQAGQVDPGFDQKRVDVASLDLSLGAYNKDTGPALVKELLARLRALPNVEAASATADLPLDGGRMGLGGIKVPGVPPPEGMDAWRADANVVEPGFFQTLKLPLIQGRDFTESDSAHSEPVVIINEAMASRIWPGQSALGRHVEMETGPGEGSRTLTVVGVASNAKLMSLNEAAEPYFYVPLSQYNMARMSLLVRSKDGGSTIPQIRSILRGINSNLPLTEAMPLSEVTALELLPQSMAAAVAGSLGVVGMLLAAIGIYGVTAYSVSRRRRELAIRMALGADHGRVIRFVLRHTLFLTAVGMTLGMVLAAVGSRLIESFLFGMKGLDVITFGAAFVLFALVTMVASYIPARRASTVDPMMALRSE